MSDVGRKAHLKHEAAIVLIASAVAPACQTSDGTKISGNVGFFVNKKEHYDIIVKQN